MINNETLEPSPASENRSRLRGELVLYIVALVILGVFMGVRSFDGSEDRWAEAVREMMLTGDWLHPSNNFEIYFDKPILSYWLIGGAATLFGGLNEWTLRLPSLIFALITLWSTVRIFTVMFTHRVGLIAGWLLFSCYGFVHWANSAEADMAQLGMIMLSLAWFFHVKDRAKFHHYLLFYVMLAIGTQFKGMPALIVPVLVAAIWCIMNGEVRRQISLGHVVAFLLALPLHVAIPLLADYIAPSAGVVWPHDGAHFCEFAVCPGKIGAFELFIRENITRAVDPFDHNNPWYIYFLEVPRIVLLWTPVCILALFATLAKVHKLPRNTLTLLVMMAGIFVVFTLSGSRRWYYILPIAPFVMAMTAVFIEEHLEHKWFAASVQGLRYLAITAVSLLVISLLVWPFWVKIMEHSLPLLLWLSLPTLGIALMVLLIADERDADFISTLALPPRAGTVIILVATLSTGLFVIIEAVSNDYRTTRPFLLETHEMVKLIPNSQMISYLTDDSNELLYYWGFTSRNDIIHQRKARRIPDEKDLRPREEQIASYMAATADKLIEMLHAKAATGDTVVLISRNENMVALERWGVPAAPEFDREKPDYVEARTLGEPEKEAKFYVWILKSEDILNANTENKGGINGDGQ